MIKLSLAVMLEVPARNFSATDDAYLRCIGCPYTQQTTAPYSTIKCNKGQVTSRKRLLDVVLVDVPQDVRSIERWVAPG